MRVFLLSLLQTCPGLEQYAIKKFAESLEAFPRALAENAGIKVKDQCLNWTPCNSDQLGSMHWFEVAPI